MFVRFVVGTDAEDPAWLTGIITEARLLRDAGELYDYEAERLEAIYDWFNEHLPRPPFEKKLKSGEWTRDAVAWFRAEAKGPIGRMWDIVAILKEHGVAVRMVTTERLGRIVYEDEYQVVAETPYCNSYKGTDIAARDRRTRKIVPLFNPRRHKWSRHFRWKGGTLIGLTPIGRVTITLLKMNDPIRVELRESLIEEGLFPPG